MCPGSPRHLIERPEARLQLKTAAVGLFVSGGGGEIPTSSFIIMGYEVRYILKVRICRIYFQPCNNGGHPEQVLRTDTLAQAPQVEQIIVPTQYFLL